MHPSVLTSLTSTIVAAIATPLAGAADNPRELGAVHWARDLDSALAQAKACDKPVMLLFQEIPGCDGCQMFGDQPLSHPLLVEAIETLFVPVAIHNNKPGHDAQVLARFDEPASNYPVMRFLNAAGKDIVPRQDQIYSVHDVAKRLIETLATADRAVPEYLRIAMIESEARRDHREGLTFAMHCFWEGQASLGAIDGVISTTAMFYDKQEAVEVVFDPTIVSIEELVAAADKAQCATNVYAHGDVQLVHARQVVGDRASAAKSRASAAPSKDQDYWLAQSAYRWLPLTPMQRTKVNAALHLETDANSFLAPSQIALVKEIEQALAQDPNALAGLKPSETVDEMSAYAGQLRKRLATPH